MSRYIDYDAIDYRNDKMHDKSSDFIDGVVYMAERIEEAPSIDIVLCKECKLYEECEYLELGDDDFCSRGKRREP